MREWLTIPGRFNGPPGSANGGYACGLLAAQLDGVAEVTLRAPPPLGVRLDLVRDRDRVELRHGEQLIAEAVPTNPGVLLDVPSPVTPAAAARASKRFAGFAQHAYSTCYVCGPERSDGLGIFPGPVAGRPDGLVAAAWTPPDHVSEPLVWAVLDCPSGWAVDDFQREGIVLGRLAARIDALPTPGERHVVIGWGRGIDGRKRYAGSALYTGGGELLAHARATWIQLAS